jgi:glycosyltransferase involved in cell wall biosynthesis
MISSISQASPNRTLVGSSRFPKDALTVPDLQTGGGERFTVYLANGLAARGCAVDLILIEAEGPYLADVSPQVHVVNLNSRRLLRSILPLIRYLRRNRPDVLISNLTHMDLAALLAKRLAGVSTRVIPVVHTTLSQEAAESISLRGWVIGQTVNRLYPWSDAIVVVSRDAADDLLRVTRAAAEIVRVIYPILTPEIAELTKLPLDDPWFAPGQPGVVLGVGRLTRQKDFSTLIRAFAVVRRQQDFQSLRLLILGEGETRRQLEDLVKELGLTDFVAMPGRTENVFAYMARCALFVLSSAYEAMPMVLVEALVCGAPVVATNCRSGPREILHDGKFGRLVPVGNVSDLASAIRESLSEPRRPPPEEVLRPFARDTVIDQYLKLIAEVNDE